jgi:hypothetical protein
MAELLFPPLEVEWGVRARERAREDEGERRCRRGGARSASHARLLLFYDKRFLFLYYPLRSDRVLARRSYFFFLSGLSRALCIHNARILFTSLSLSRSDAEGGKSILFLYFR